MGTLHAGTGYKGRAGADLVIRAYEKGEGNYVPVISSHVTGSVNVG